MTPGGQTVAGETAAALSACAGGPAARPPGESRPPKHVPALIRERAEGRAARERAVSKMPGTGFAVPEAGGQRPARNLPRGDRLQPRTPRFQVRETPDPEADPVDAAFYQPRMDRSVTVRELWAAFVKAGCVPQGAYPEEFLGRVAAAMLRQAPRAAALHPGGVGTTAPGGKQAVDLSPPWATDQDVLEVTCVSTGSVAPSRAIGVVQESLPVTDMEASTWAEWAAGPPGSAARNDITMGYYGNWLAIVEDLAAMKVGTTRRYGELNLTWEEIFPVLTGTGDAPDGRSGRIGADQPQDGGIGMMVPPPDEVYSMVLTRTLLFGLAASVRTQMIWAWMAAPMTTTKPDFLKRGFGTLGVRNDVIGSSGSSASMNAYPRPAWFALQRLVALLGNVGAIVMQLPGTVDTTEHRVALELRPSHSGGFLWDGLSWSYGYLLWLDQESGEASMKWLFPVATDFACRFVPLVPEVAPATPSTTGTVQTAADYPGGTPDWDWDLLAGDATTGPTPSGWTAVVLPTGPGRSFAIEVPQASPDSEAGLFLLLTSEPLEFS